VHTFRSRHAADLNFNSEFEPNGLGSVFEFGFEFGLGAIHRTQAEWRILGRLQTFLEVYTRLWTHPNIRSGSGSGSDSVLLNAVRFFY
jgi:hypothetical protein